MPRLLHDFRYALRVVTRNKFVSGLSILAFALVVVLGHDFWQTRMGSNPNVLGTTLTLNGAPYEVIGVMPRGFVFRGALLYVPLAQPVDPATRGSHFLLTYARLEEGVTWSTRRRRCVRWARRSPGSSATTTASTCSLITKSSSETSAGRCRF